VGLGSICGTLVGSLLGSVEARFGMNDVLPAVTGVEVSGGSLRDGSAGSVVVTDSGRDVVGAGCRPPERLVAGVDPVVVVAKRASIEAKVPTRSTAGVLNTPLAKASADDPITNAIAIAPTTTPLRIFFGIPYSVFTAASTPLLGLTLGSRGP
jgi:hypothetical protein